MTEADKLKEALRRIATAYDHDQDVYMAGVVNEVAEVLQDAELRAIIALPESNAVQQPSDAKRRHAFSCAGRVGGECNCDANGEN